MRVSVEWRSASRENYKDFCAKHPNISLTFDEWKYIIYSFNELFREYILETGDIAKLPGGFGQFSIRKKRRKKQSIMPDGTQFVHLPIDWKKTKEKGKRVYILNYHTEGFFFGWQWFKKTARFKHSDFWNFKPSRVTSRLINEYIQKDNKYQFIYQEWKV
jgi:hypothetical protein